MLLRTLLQIALLPPSANVPEGFRQGLWSATDRQWQEAIAVLTHHRLMPLVFHGVKVHNLKDDIPKPILSQLMLKYLQSLQHNTRYELMPDPKNWCLLGRILRFLQDDFGELLPAELAEFAQQYKPFTLEGITRQNQLVMWGLHRPQGWVKMAASVVGVHSNPKFEYPEVSHLLKWAAADLWVGDRLSP
jgi:hypothetical protein